MSRVPLERKVLSENDRIAAGLRALFRQHSVLCLNLVSSPGAGKTSLLEKTLERFAARERVAVLTGDIQTDNDARRLARFGFPVKQITTGGACHLDARMVERALADWLPALRRPEGLGGPAPHPALRDGAPGRLEGLNLLLIENVGNLVCPSSYDLGEAAKIVVLSVAEGDDKPLKYPAMFFKSELLVINKIDLLPYVSFEVARAREHARRVHPKMEILEVSCTTGAGLEDWVRWLERRRGPFGISNSKSET